MCFVELGTTLENLSCGHRLACFMWCKMYSLVDRSAEYTKILNWSIGCFCHWFEVNSVNIFDRQIYKLWRTKCIQRTMFTFPRVRCLFETERQLLFLTYFTLHSVTVIAGNSFEHKKKEDIGTINTHYISTTFHRWSITLVCRICSTL